MSVKLKCAAVAIIMCMGIGALLGYAFKSGPELPPIPKAIIESGDYSELNRQGVVMYSLSTCPLCTEISAAMDEWGVNYEEREIGSNDKFLEQARSLGAQSVPILLIGQYKIEGYDKDMTFDVLKKEGLL